MDVVDPNTVNDLVGFLNSYTQDPMATIMGLVANQHEQGSIKNPEFSLEALEQMLNGGGQPAPQPGMQQGVTEEIPEWAKPMAQQLAEMSQAEQQRQQAEQQRQAQAQEAENQRLLIEAYGTIREQLKAAGLPEFGTDGKTPMITDERLHGAILAHKGDLQAVIGEFTSYRDGLVGNFTQQNGGRGNGPTIEGGVPAVPNTTKPNSRDPYAKARAGAHQRLAMANQAEAQGQ
jgi:hypothetical protein